MLMNGRFLLDTNIIIALFDDEANVKYNLAQVSEVFIPSIVIGEKSPVWMQRLSATAQPECYLQA